MALRRTERPTLGRTRRRLFAGILALAALAPAGCERPQAVHGGGGIRRDAAADDPISFGEVADFALVDQTGREVSRGDLLGHPWVLACIFTTCTGPCPQLTAGMAELQGELADTDVRLVSLSVDPDIDTPEVLRAYAERHGADPERWSFLTGDGSAIDELVVKSFLLPLQRELPGPELPLGIHVTHSTELVAVDRGGRIRGYYGGRTRDGLQQLAERMRALADEAPPAPDRP